MYKILTIDVGNTPDAERKSYDEAEKKLNDLEKQGWSVVSTSWDDGGLQGGQMSGMVVILNKK